MSNLESLQPERWDNVLPKAFEDFKDIDFDKSKFRIPFEEFEEIDNDQLLSISMLYNLGQRESMLRFCNPDTHLEKFRRGYQQELKGDNLESIFLSLYHYDNSNGRNFTKFLCDNVAVHNSKDKREIWREILSCSIAYSLKNKERDNLVSSFSQKLSTYEAVRSFF